MSKFNPNSDEYNVAVSCNFPPVTIDGELPDWDLSSDGFVLPTHGYILTLDKECKNMTITKDGVTAALTLESNDIRWSSIKKAYAKVTGTSKEVTPDTEGFYLLERECGGCGAPFGVRKLTTEQFTEYKNVGTELLNHTPDEAKVYGIDDDDRILGVAYCSKSRCLCCREI